MNTKNLFFTFCFLAFFACNSNQSEIVPPDDIKAGIENPTDSIPEGTGNLYNGDTVMVRVPAIIQGNDTVTSDNPQNGYSYEITCVNTNILADEVTEVGEAVFTGFQTFYAFDLSSETVTQVRLTGLKYGFWHHAENSETANWRTSRYAYYQDWRNGTPTQTFEVKEKGKPCHLWIAFYPTDRVTIEFFEAGNQTPVKSKELYVRYTGLTSELNVLDSTTLVPNR
jgi:hypothetical protein